MSAYKDSAETLKRYHELISKVEQSVRGIEAGSRRLDAETGNRAGRICGDLLQILAPHRANVEGAVALLEGSLPTSTQAAQHKQLDEMRLRLSSLPLRTRETPHNQDIVPELVGRLVNTLDEDQQLRQQAFNLQARAMQPLKQEYEKTIASIIELSEFIDHGQSLSVERAAPPSLLAEQPEELDVVRSVPADVMDDAPSGSLIPQKLKEAVIAAGLMDGDSIVETPAYGGGPSGFNIRDRQGVPVPAPIPGSRSAERRVGARPVTMEMFDQMSSEQERAFMSRVQSPELAYAGIEPSPGIAVEGDLGHGELVPSLSEAFDISGLQNGV